MRKKIAGLTLAGFMAGAALAPMSASAANAMIERAKGQCVVGEQTDGYLGVVSGAEASDELRREVRDINQQRKAYYADIARRNGVTIRVTAALTAEKLINSVSRGECYRTQGGQWVEVE